MSSVISSTAIPLIGVKEIEDLPRQARAGHLREELNRLAEKISIDYYEYCRIEQELGSLKPETTLDRKVREQIKGLVVVVPDPQLLIAPRWTLLGGTPIQPGKVPTGDVDLASLLYQLLESAAHAVMIA